MTSLRFCPEQIELLPIARLKPYERNPRLHSDDQVAKVAASIASYGWTQPIPIADDGTVIAGHGRLLAAQHLGLTEVPVIRLTELTPEPVSTPARRPTLTAPARVGGTDVRAGTEKRTPHGPNIKTAGNRRTRCRHFRYLEPKPSPLHETGASPYYLWGHEPCFFGWLKGNKPPRVSDDYPTTVWTIPTVKVGEKTDHPTSKPVDVFAIPMRQHARPGEICYEPFSGSGSQIMAGETTGRRVFAIEISARYVDVAVKRWQTASAKQATLDGDGRTFDRVAGERLPRAA